MSETAKEKATAERLDRREFTALSVLAMLSGVAVTVSGCGGGGGGSTGGRGGTALDDGYNVPTGGSPVATDGVAGSISANHGHTATISNAELSGGVMVSLSIRGGATHNHSVDVTVEELGQIAGGQRVVKRSSNNESHFHEVTFN